MPAITFVCVDCRHRTEAYQHPCPVCAGPHRKRGESCLVVDLTEEDYNYRLAREALIPQAEKNANAALPSSEWSSGRWSRIFAYEMARLAHERGLVAYAPRPLSN